jgi:hypothetical protein
VLGIAPAGGADDDTGCTAGAGLFAASVGRGGGRGGLATTDAGSGVPVGVTGRDGCTYGDVSVAALIVAGCGVGVTGRAGNPGPDAVGAGPVSGAGAPAAG